MVGACADMRPHADGGEEIGSAPLDVDTLKCIRIVACPEFVEVGQYTVVDTSAAAGASLYRQLRIAGANASAHVLKTPVVFDVQVALIVFGQVLRTSGGLQSLLDNARKHGIRFGIWLEPEMANTKSELYIWSMPCSLMSK